MHIIHIYYSIKYYSINSKNKIFNYFYFTIYLVYYLVNSIISILQVK